ncbi:MAG: hypothetical protein ABEI52_12190, partial [Halobacteriaceae archaeon]
TDIDSEIPPVNFERGMSISAWLGVSVHRAGQDQLKPVELLFNADVESMSFYSCHEYMLIW